MVIVALLCVVIAAASCDSGSGAGTSSSARSSAGSAARSTSPSSPSLSSPPPTKRPEGIKVGRNPATRLKVDAWGVTSDGLLSVVVSNVGDATIRSARAIISGRDKFGNVVASVSAPAGTALGTRCCTIIGLAPGRTYGLYSDIGTKLRRVKSVSVQYTSVRTGIDNVKSPVLWMRNPSIHRGENQADVYVTVKMAKRVGPYITVQALLKAPDNTFLGVISSSFYCLKANTERRIELQFFHPVPVGTSVDSVLSYPLDATTAKLERLQPCGPN